MLERKATRVRIVLNADLIIRQGKVTFNLRCKRHRDGRVILLRGREGVMVGGERAAFENTKSQFTTGGITA